MRKIRKPIPCKVLGADYEWMPVFNVSYRLWGVGDIMHRGPLGVYVLGDLSTPTKYSARSGDRNYVHDLDDALHVAETSFLVGA